MIYVDVTGRCGNQLFQYAFARKLSILNNDQSFVFDFFHTERIRKDKNDSSFCETLNCFNVLPYKSMIDNGNNVQCNGSRRQQKIYRKYPLARKISYRLPHLNLLQKYQNKMQKNGIYKEDECFFTPIKTKEKDIFIRGYFEDQLYFDDIKDILFKEFEPKYPKKEKNKKLYDVIENEESVCVSFRVWSEIADQPELVKQRDVCTKEYYISAIEKMHELHPDATFIVFSNDVEWVKKNIDFKYPVYFEAGDDEVWEKLRLMYSCKHFIMSTSTFCWWAQYLSRNPNKTVISPSKWYADEKTSKLLREEWIKISY